MKLFVLLLVAAASLRAQERTTVSFPDAQRPRKIIVENMLGSVTVRGYAGQEAIIEVTGGNGRARRGRQDPPSGMHRIGTASGDAVVSQDGNTVKVNMGVFGGDNLNIQVPVQTDVKVETLSGDNITIENVSGEVEASNMNGDVMLINVGGPVVAHSMNGKVTATLSNVMPDKAMSFSTFNGTIEVTLPGSIKANVKMKTNRGDMFTDFDVQLVPPASGKRRGERVTTGTINGGGPEIQFTTFNGDILIHKR